MYVLRLTSTAPLYQGPEASHFRLALGPPASASRQSTGLTPEDPRRQKRSSSSLKLSLGAHRNTPAPFTLFRMHPIARQMFRRQLQATLRQPSQAAAPFRRASTAATTSSKRTCSTSFGTPFLLRSPATKTTRRSYSSAPPPPPGSSDSNYTVKFWPFVAIIAAGTGAWVLLVNRRKGRWSIAPLE